MAELEPADVESFTKGRLKVADADTQRLLDAALSCARRECMWHVSPVRTGDVLVLDGPANALLTLPTRKLIDLSAVAEDGNAVDLAKVTWSETGSVRKNSRLCWTGKYRGLSVTMTHGFTEIEAADWRNAVLSMVDKMSLMPIPASGGRSQNELVRKKIDDVEYQWSDGALLTAAEQALYSVSNVIDWYRLNPVYYL